MGEDQIVGLVNEGITALGTDKGLDPAVIAALAASGVSLVVALLAFLKARAADFRASAANDGVTDWKDTVSALGGVVLGATADEDDDD